MNTKENIGRGLAWFIISLAIMLGLYVVWYTDKNPRTDDAYLWANSIKFSADVSGRIKELLIEDNQSVKKNQSLLVINSEQYELKLAQAKSHLATLEQQLLLTRSPSESQKNNAQEAQQGIERAIANLKLATENLGKQEVLYEQNLTTKKQLEEAQHSQNSAATAYNQALVQAVGLSKAPVLGSDSLEVQLEAARADFRVAEKALANTKVLAPFDGKIVNLKTTVGDYVSIAENLFSLINTTAWFAIANFRETELKNIKIGDDVLIYVMANNQTPLQGKVHSIGWGVSPSSLNDNTGLPNVPRSLNWVKVAQRFPVRITISNPPEELMRIGASVSVVIKPIAHK